MGEQRQTTKNCHFVSRFLTRPWEFRHGTQERQLRYYDFDLNAFDVTSSRALFAENEINSQAVEDWLRDRIETPLARIRPRLAKGDRKALDDWSFFRAAVLMVLLQGARGNAAEDNQEAKESLNWFASLPEDQLNAFVVHSKSTFDFRLVFSWDGAQKSPPLLFPSTGIFHFAFPDAGAVGGFAFGIALPLDLHCALAITPLELHGAIDLSLLPASLQVLSVGTWTARRVVVPPGSPTPDAEIRSHLMESRRLNDVGLTSLEKVREIVAAMYAKVGLTTNLDRFLRTLPG